MASRRVAYLILPSAVFLISGAAIAGKAMAPPMAAAADCAKKARRLPTERAEVRDGATRRASVKRLFRREIMVACEFV